MHQTGFCCNFAPSTLIKAGPEKPNSKESKEMKILYDMIQKVFNKGDKFYHSTMEADEFKQQNSEEILRGLYKKSRHNDNMDWGNTLYTSQDRNVAYGYIDQDGQIGLIIELEATEDIPCISSSEEVYADGSCGQDTPDSTKDAISSLLGETVNEPFMTFLGSKGYVFECYHDLDHRKEVLIPSAMVEKLKVISVSRIRYNKKTYEMETID